MNNSAPVWTRLPILGNRVEVAGYAVVAIIAGGKVGEWIRGLFE